MTYIVTTPNRHPRVFLATHNDEQAMERRARVHAIGQSERHGVAFLTTEDADGVVSRVEYRGGSVWAGRVERVAEGAGVACFNGRTA